MIEDELADFFVGYYRTGGHQSPHFGGFTCLNLNDHQDVARRIKAGQLQGQ